MFTLNQNLQSSNEPVFTGSRIGTLARDRLIGDDHDNALIGREGNDLIRGKKGNDSIWGGEDHDELYGNNGDDELDGSKGNDKLFGGRGNDKLYGGNGKDLLDGGPGNDFIRGGKGIDQLRGGNGKDIFYWDKSELDGYDVIYDFRVGEDALKFSNINQERIELSCNGNDTFLTIRGEIGSSQHTLHLIGVDLSLGASTDVAVQRLIDQGAFKL